MFRSVVAAIAVSLLFSQAAVFAQAKANISAKANQTTVRSAQTVTDGISNTIMLVESTAERAVIWTKPDDLAVDLDDVLNGLKGAHQGGFLVALTDSSVRLVSLNVDLDTFKGY